MATEQDVENKTILNEIQEVDKENESTKVSIEQEDGNWGSLVFDMNLIEKMVSFAEEISNMPDVRTEEIEMEGAGDRERGYGKRVHYRDDDERSFERKNEREGFSPKKRRAFEDNRYKRTAYDSGYSRPENGRFGERKEYEGYGERFEHRPGGDRGFDGRRSYGPRSGYRDDDNRRFERKDFGDRGYRGDDRRRDGDYSRGGERDRFRNYDRDRPDFRGDNHFRGNTVNSPPPSKIIGIFGIPVSVTHDELIDFLRFNIPDIPFQNVHLVKDRQTGMSRGFAFVYFDTMDNSTRAKEMLIDKEIQQKKIRVDFAMNNNQRRNDVGMN